MNIAECLRFIKNQLTPISGENALFEAEQMLQQGLQYSRSKLYLQRNSLISDELETNIYVWLERRKCHEPLPYILGVTYFHSKEFIVNSDVLIPRPDTEIIIEVILDTENDKKCRFLEIGIGSGAISAILLMEHPDWQCIATDVSFPALLVAKQNCPENIHLVCSDLFFSIKPETLFDFIVSNPPYISESEMAGLDASVKDFEPTIALDGGRDGLDFYRTFALQAGDFLKPRGKLYCEIGYSQHNSVSAIFSSHGWKDVKIVKDLAGRPRVVMCTRK
jgi:release factor glutamine methyltransferase